MRLFRQRRFWVRESRLTGPPVSLFSARMVGRSLKQIVWARLRRDKVAMICLGILVAYFFIAVFGPFIGRTFFGLDPYAFDRSSISDLGGKPDRRLGGSAGSTRSVSSGGPGATSCRSSSGDSRSRSSSRPARRSSPSRSGRSSASSPATWRRTDQFIGRLTDLTLAFPFLLIILALSNVLTDRITTLGVPSGNPSRDRLPDHRHQHLRLAVPRPHRARPGHQPARARVRRGRGRDGRQPAPHPVHRDPAQPLGADHRLHHVDPARVHRARGGAVVPRCRRHPARHHVRRDARQLGQLFPTGSRPTSSFRGSSFASSWWRSTSSATPSGTRSIPGSRADLQRG